MGRRWRSVVAGVLAGWGLASASIAQDAPPQRLNSAVLIYPLIRADRDPVDGVTRDTHIDLLNLTSRTVQVSCFFVNAQGNFCNEIGFRLTLTPNQPVSWLASQGFISSFTHSAVPPFNGSGELKCVVLPSDPSVDAHNTIQGRAIVFVDDGQTLGYGAVAFRRLVDGELTSEVELDGVTYTACPDEQHFAFLAAQPGSETEIILAPCSEDLENQVFTTTTVQFVIVNEFEEHLSAAITVDCYLRRRLSQVSSVFKATSLGSETGHLIVRGVQHPVSALLIDRFTVDANAGAALNEPALVGGRAATIRFP